ncbi:hypothetical protein D9615_000358 [Tricholomella constricta]|uniref:RRM domain-containing protein n=1 Tax=Tricholomella constricta TaxID=117010 RepID=A0A8H5HRE7_9AGAR|nr:hypothetical protein D9615_000358 [Tricholomella constricta]
MRLYKVTCFAHLIPIPLKVSLIIMRANWNQPHDTVKRPASTAPPEGRRNTNDRAKTSASKRAGISQYKRGDKYRRIQDAKKRVELRTNADKSQNPIRRNYPFVYVGNLKSTITEERLEELFAPCGKIHHTSIRCSRGQAVTVGVSVDQLTSRDRQYASIEFMTLEGAKLALHLHGKLIDGLEIVVATSPADLPEVQDIVHSRIGQAREKKGLLNQFQRKLKSKPIPTEPTEEFNRPVKADRHRLFGISFAKCII